jgi:hypothetical protein
MRATSHRWLGLFVMTLLAVPSLAMAQGPRLQLDNLSRLASQASEVTDISLDPAMLQLAGNFLAANEPEQAAVKQMMAELKGVHVKSFEFDRDDAYSTADVESVRKQLTGAWTRLVFVTEASKTGRELVEIYSYREGDRSTGLAILVAEPRELTVVNIVGPIDLSKLAALQGKLGIPNIPAK